MNHAAKSTTVHVLDTPKSISDHAVILTPPTAEVNDCPERVIWPSPVIPSSPKEEVIGGALVIPTGIQLTGSVGSPNITAWAEIDLGVNNVWTPVDLAA